MPGGASLAITPCRARSMQCTTVSSAVNISMRIRAPAVCFATAAAAGKAKGTVGGRSRARIAGEQDAIVPLCPTRMPPAHAKPAVGPGWAVEDEQPIFYVPPLSILQQNSCLIGRSVMKSLPINREAFCVMRISWEGRFRALACLFRRGRASSSQGAVGRRSGHRASTGGSAHALPAPRPGVCL